MPALLAVLWTGWLVQQRLTWLQDGLRLEGRVVELRRSSQPGATGTSRRSVRLSVVVEVADPRRDGQLTQEVFLAPLIYALIDEGDLLAVLHDPLTLPAHEAFVLAHPFQLWQAPALGLLLAAVGWALPHASLHRRYAEPAARRRAVRRRLAVLTLALLLPIAGGQARALRDRASHDADLALEARWPAWPALDAAVPRPWWWARLPWHGVDPVSAAASLGYVWRDPGAWWQRGGASERSFKLARARMLALRDQPSALAGLLSRGHDANFIPLYRFYLAHYLDARWNEPGCPRCNDASQVTEMAGDLMWMLVQQGRLDEPDAWVPAIVRDKLPGADARARLAFLTAYRGLLEARDGADAAREHLQPLVDDAVAAAHSQGDDWALPRWRDFWRGYVPRPPARPA
ncbi:hypothetical protein ACG02S_23750 [Roseateles sp. DC23W]|uniref:DUF4129 domain-containing protein n=1 Tax=Pelomonas dachongensis TaxID=3299029 RepID=A0ABW7EWD9_9BURK